MGDETIRTRHWTRLEYDRLIETGFFQPGDKVELIGGQLMVAEPQGTRHATGIRLAAEILRRVFGTGWNISVQLPIALDDESEPEPDVAVVPGAPGDYWHAHPSRPALVVEVAESSLPVDRVHKASLYARGRVADYWIVNLVDNVLEVSRQPVPTPEAPYGWAYAEVQRLRPGDSVSPLAAPSATVAAADLLR